MQDMKLEPGSFRTAKSGLSSEFDTELVGEDRKWWKLQFGKKGSGKDKEPEVQLFPTPSIPLLGSSKKVEGIISAVSEHILQFIVIIKSLICLGLQNQHSPELLQLETPVLLSACKWLWQIAKL